jgi:hypothetical protein
MGFLQEEREWAHALLVCGAKMVALYLDIKISPNMQMWNSFM